MSKNSCIAFRIDKKKQAIATLVFFAFIFLTDYLIHGLWLKDAYVASASLWRPEQDMQQFMGWLIAGQALIAISFTALFAVVANCYMCHRGVCFGLFMGLFSVAHSFIQYAVTPLPQNILWSWVAGCLIQSVVGAFLLSFVYKVEHPCCGDEKKA